MRPCTKWRRRWDNIIEVNLAEIGCGRVEATDCSVCVYTDL
jgi:hypothetical protein